MLFCTSSLLIPMPEVAFAWGSKSIKRTLFPISPKKAAKLTVVVVFGNSPLLIGYNKCFHFRFPFLLFHVEHYLNRPDFLSKYGSHHQPCHKSRSMRDERRCPPSNAPKPFVL